MPIITITSDWNGDDYYLASVKGKILSRCGDALITDISHRIDAFNKAGAAFILRNTYGQFPEGSIHLFAVSSEPLQNDRLLAARMKGHFFLCADNGILGLLGDPGPDEVVSIDWKADKQGSSFVELNYFADLACRIAEGEALSDLGSPCNDYIAQVPRRPTLEGNILQGMIIYVDSYQNAISNISREYFEEQAGGRAYRIFLQSRHYQIDEISQAYRDVDEGEYLALWNSLGLLEIAIRNGNAAGLLNLKTGASIRVEFNEDENA